MDKNIKVQVTRLTKKFGDLLVLNDVSLTYTMGNSYASSAPPAAEKPLF